MVVETVAQIHALTIVQKIIRLLQQFLALVVVLVVMDNVKALEVDAEIVTVLVKVIVLVAVNRLAQVLLVKIMEEQIALNVQENAKELVHLPVGVDVVNVPAAVKVRVEEQILIV